MTQDETTAIIYECQAGNKEAFNQLYEQYYWMVYAQAKKMSQNDADAHDITQEVFYEVYQNIASLRNPQMFTLWLHRITHSKAIRLFRSSREEYYESSMLDAFSVEQSQKSTAAQEKHMRFQSDAKVLQNLMASLKPKHAEVLRLMYLEGLSLQEIADHLDIPLGTVKTRVATARKKLAYKVALYEKENQTTLNFHTDVMFPITSLTFIDMIKQNISTSWTHACKHVVCLSVTGVVVYTGVTQVLPDLNGSMQPEPILTNRENTQTSNMKEFPSVTVDHQTYHTAKTAYYGLLKWSDLEDLATKSKAECMHIQPLYDALKQSNSTYYQQLQQDGWAGLFETQLK